MATKIGITGSGNVGGALARGLERAGYEVKAVSTDKRANGDTAAWADVVIFAGPFGAVADVAKEIKDAVRGKVVVDATTLAKELGATHVIDGKKEDARARIMEITRQGVDYLVDLTGQPSTLSMGLNVLTPPRVGAPSSAPRRPARRYRSAWRRRFAFVDQGGAALRGRGLDAHVL